MKTYRINDLLASAWENAVINAGKYLAMSPSYAICQWVYVTATADKIGLLFDENGNII